MQIRSHHTKADWACLCLRTLLSCTCMHCTSTYPTERGTSGWGRAWLVMISLVSFGPPSKALKYKNPNTWLPDLYSRWSHSCIQTCLELPEPTPTLYLDQPRIYELLRPSESNILETTSSQSHPAILRPIESLEFEQLLVQVSGRFPVHRWYCSIKFKIFTFNASWRASNYIANEKPTV